MGRELSKPENHNGWCGEKIRRLRTEHGWTQFQLADRCGLSAGTIGGIERNWSDFSTKVLVSLCEAFNVSADTIVGGPSADSDENSAYSEGFERGYLAGMGDATAQATEFMQTALRERRNHRPAAKDE